MFNHSCVPSALYEIVGDVMAVRARVDIEEGTEVSISYHGAPFEAGHGGDDNEQKVKRIFAKHFPTPSGCQCLACRANQLDGSTRLDRRRQLMKTRYVKVAADLRSLNATQSQSSAAVVRQAQQLVSDLQETYSPSRGINFRYGLSQAEHLLAEILYARRDKFHESVKHSFLSLEALGLVISPSPLVSHSSTTEPPKVRVAPYCLVRHAVCTLLIISGRYLGRGELDAAHMWARLARETDAMASAAGGGDDRQDEHFKNKYQKFLESVGIVSILE